MQWNFKSRLSELYRWYFRQSKLVFCKIFLWVVSTKNQGNKIYFGTFLHLKFIFFSFWSKWKSLKYRNNYRFSYVIIVSDSTNIRYLCRWYSLYIFSHCQPGNNVSKVKNHIVMVIFLLAEKLSDSLNNTLFYSKTMSTSQVS